MEKKESPVKRARLPFLVGAVILGTALAMLNIPWLTGIGALLASGVFWFFRDPERIIPQGENLVVSPADGKILSITETEEHRFLKKKAKKISIFLNIFDVHVNRLPASGKILGITYQPGKFLPANKDLASKENEQNAVFLETESGHKMVFIQVAGLIARRILCWVKDEEQVTRGDRFGMIRFGSRTDIFLPLDTDIKVSPGDQVKGGSTIIGILK